MKDWSSVGAYTAAWVQSQSPAFQIRQAALGVTLRQFTRFQDGTVPLSRLSGRTQRTPPEVMRSPNLPATRSEPRCHGASGRARIENTQSCVASCSRYARVYDSYNRIRRSRGKYRYLHHAARDEKQHMNNVVKSKRHQQRYHYGTSSVTVCGVSSR